MELSNKIKKLRNKLRLSQTELASKIDVSLSTLRRWENGERAPGAKDLTKLALAFNTSVSYLFGETDDATVHLVDKLVGNVHVAGSISEALVNGSGIVIVRNGREQVLSDELSELVRLYEMFDVRRRMALLNRAFELEGEMQESKG